MLVHLEANYVQGWLYGRPAPTEKLAAMIEEAPRMVPIQLATGADKFEVSCLEALPTQRLAQLRAIYDGAPVGLCFLDRELRYVSANQKLADFTGQSVASYLGKTMKELLPDTYRKAEPFLKRALLGEPISGLVLNRIPAEASGREMTILVSYQPAWDEAGEVIGISVSVSDITEKKRTEYYIREDENQYPLFQPVVFAA